MAYSVACVVVYVVVCVAVYVGVGETFSSRARQQYTRWCVWLCVCVREN